MSSGKKSRPPKNGSNARERARIAAEQAALRKKRRNLGIIIAAVVLIVVGSGIGYAAWRSYGNVNAGTYTGQGWGPVTITNNQPIVLGAEDAGNTIGLFADYRCPHCDEFERKFGDTITQMQEKGELKLELYAVAFVDPQGSANAANALACAAEEGFGQAYNIGLWENYGKPWTPDQLIDLAGKVADPKPAFNTCVTSNKHLAWVQSMANTAQQKGVTGTPSLFIGGKQQNLSTVMEWTPQEFRDAVTSAS
jgi:protein-disulfide isomerase